MRAKEFILEGKYGGAPYTFDLPRRQLNVPLLIQKGAIFVTHPHSEQGWETGANIPDWQFSLITLHNLYHLPWCADAKKYLKPEAYNQVSKQIHSVTDGKYNQILWSIQKLGIPEEQAFLDAVKENKMRARDFIVEARQYLDFDSLYGKVFKITDNNGNPSNSGFSIVTPLNGASWNWKERPEFKNIVKQKLNDPGFLEDHKYQQIIDTIAGNKFNPANHLYKKNT